MILIIVIIIVIIIHSVLPLYTRARSDIATVARYGIALAALGMLATLSCGLTIDGFGPISDNAGGIAETCSNLRVAMPMFGKKPYSGHDGFGI